jgi:hypothetical protein
MPAGQAHHCLYTAIDHDRLAGASVKRGQVTNGVSGCLQYAVAASGYLPSPASDWLAFFTISLKTVA